MTKYEPVIGMEVHVELQTESKMFCGCRVEFGGEPNTRCCPVCLGLPGSLPVVNERAIELMSRTALALHCAIAPRSIFHRKNYYYPDLPKNYQISQYDDPIGSGGYIELGSGKRIAIRRVHMEEDTGKLLHIEGNLSYVDYNRSGVPLMEIVTQNPPPEGLEQIESADEAREYLQRLRQILLYLGVSDVKMEEGSMRCEPNISIRPVGQTAFGTKTEIKNLNSFRAVYLGVDYEIRRQEKALLEGERIVQETRRWDDARGVTVSMRSKEFEQEYRYFPEPDLAPMLFDDRWIQRLRAELPELPMEKARRFVNDYGISQADAEILSDTVEMADFFDATACDYRDPKAAANWLTGELLRLLNASSMELSQAKVTPRGVRELLDLMDSGVINRNTGKSIFEEMFNTGRGAREIVTEKGLEQVSDAGAIEVAVERVIAAHPGEVERYRGGEAKLIGFFVGRVMRETSGKANPGLVNKLLKEKLS